MSPPKTVFSKEDIIATAFTIAQHKGIQYVTARSVAAKLKASVAPVYSHFESMEKLQEETIKRGVYLLLEYMQTMHTDQIFLNMGIGMALFARDERQLFKAIFLGDGKYRDIINRFHVTLLEQMKKDPNFTKMSVTHRKTLLNKMAIVTLGLAVLINTDIIKDNSLEFITKILSDIGSDIIGATFQKIKE